MSASTTRSSGTLTPADAIGAASVRSHPAVTRGPSSGAQHLARARSAVTPPAATGTSTSARVRPGAGAPPAERMR
jgi:hypothetical protein